MALDPTATAGPTEAAADDEQDRDAGSQVADPDSAETDAETTAETTADTELFDLSVHRFGNPLYCLVASLYSLSIVKVTLGIERGLA